MARRDNKRSTKAETLRRKQVRETKYAVRELSTNLAGAR